MTSATTDRISKVTVQFYDPSGVFPVLSRQLESHLPLRNLHWKSQNRPLRSIDFLHVDLVGTKDAPSKAQEGRHQIPGLRQTPYLKLFLLRCDDVDAYRENGRKSLREWLKANNLPSQSSSSSTQENHDAYEWMILHVVFPNTAAASQPRYSKSSNKDEEPSGKTSSKLLGRSSNTILEKIKADFNVSSKSAPDRVAQVRLQADDIPPNQLPTKKAGEAGHIETAQDRQNAWNDVVAKFKLLILSSFDLRVRQYEEDIKERGSQRTLPGWNFCTFFVLKEGLSMGLESVGLLDDALLGYDELSAELDSVLRDEPTAMNTFLDTTPELKDLLMKAVKPNDEATSIWNSKDKPIDPRRKDYRALILSNDISVFDFKSYIFSRQIILLRRMGILHSSEVARIKSDKPSSTQQSEDAEDLSCLAQLCQRAASFVTSVSRVLRAELDSAAQAESLESAERVIEEIALSWTYAVAAQMLDETTTQSLTAALAKMNKGSQSQSSPNKPKTGHSKHTSSRGGGGALAAPYEQVPEDAQVIFETLRHGTVTSPNAAAGASGIEFEELAARRADLVLLQRRTLEKLGFQREWFVGIHALRKGVIAVQGDLKDVVLDRSEDEEEEEAAEHEEKVKPELGPGICHEDLRRTFQSKGDYTRSYESITSMALNHYFAANRPKAIEELFADLAIIGFEKGDMVGAAGYFSRITPLYAERQWHLIEESLLSLHAQCLKTLHRRDDYIQILLRILENAVNRQRSLATSKLGSGSLEDLSLRDDLPKFGDHGLIEELLEAAGGLPYDVTVPMYTLFDKIVIDPYIQHFEDKDGFSIRIKFRHLLAESFAFDSAKLQLSSTEEGHKQEIVLLGGAIEANQGVCSIEVRTNITTRGLFQAEQFSLQAGKLVFMLKTITEPDKTQHVRLDKRQALSEQPLPQILCYLSNESFYASIKASQDVHLDKPRRLELSIESGRNEIHAAEVRVRSATAGLRLRTADAKIQHQGHTRVKLEKATAPGVIQLKDLSQSSTLALSIPYEVEREAPAITVRLEISYQTSAGEYMYSSVKTVSIALPVDVNVRDLFKSTFIRSTFNMKPAGQTPLNILSIKLFDTKQFEIQSAVSEHTALLVFPEQSAQKSYRIRPREQEHTRLPARKEASLNLSIWYQCLDEQVTSSLRTRLTDQLEESELKQFSRLLSNFFDVQVRRWLTTNQLSRIGILREISPPSFADIGWPSLLARLPRGHRDKLQAWLEDWHNKNQILSLNMAESLMGDSPDSARVRRLDITVPVPRLPVLHAAKLWLPPNPSHIFTTGSLISAKLSIVHTRRWDCLEAFESLESADGALDFVFELDAPPDIWLIAGQRRTRFSAKEDEVLNWDILLMPLKAGRIFLPSVEVRPAGKGMEELGCDTFYESMGETVVVINDVGSTTIALQDNPMGTEPVLLGLESRM